MLISATVLSTNSDTGAISSAYNGISKSVKAIASGSTTDNGMAALAIRELLRGEIAANQQAVRNANDAISMIQTFDASAVSVSEKLTRMIKLAEQATTDKTEALENLIEAMKADIRYAENTVNFDDDKLKLIGWAGKKAKTPLAPPGQTRLLEAPKQGAGWVYLDWKTPADGGKPKAYKVQRRVVGAEPVSDRWEDIATAILTEATLVDQPEKTELEYCVIAINKAGEGQASNTVMVVL